MKKNKILFAIAILFFAACVLISFFIIFKQLFGKEIYAVYFLILTGIIVARKGVRQQNIEEGRDVGYQKPLSKAMVRHLNITVMVFGLIALCLILKTMIL